jgi:hypothetical protein
MKTNLFTSFTACLHFCLQCNSLLYIYLYINIYIYVSNVNNIYTHMRNLIIMDV